jgi:translocator protein
MKFYSFKFLQTLALLAVIYVNYLANSLPINGMTTGALSALYPNYFVPAGVTFSIWGVIYLLLLIYVFRSWFENPHSKDAGNIDRYVWFMVSCAGNAGWIFAWHYQLIWLSLGLMLLLLFSLVRLYLLTRNDRWPLRVPVSVYLGWISVATIANATALLVSMGWQGGSIGEPAWAIVMMSAAVVISSAIRLRFNDPFYQLVVIWAILGIYWKFSGSVLPAASLMQVAALALTGVLALILVTPLFVRKVWRTA